MLGRVAYVVNVFPKLSETFIAWELAELRRRGVEVCILSLRPPDEGRRHEIVREAGLEERVIYDPKEFRAALLEFQPELLHAHFATEPTAAARELAAELRVPFTFTAHGYDIYRRRSEEHTSELQSRLHLVCRLLLEKKKKKKEKASVPA